MSSFLSAIDTPMTVYVVSGEVVIIGPDGVSLSITADAAEESARRLSEAVLRARAGQSDLPDSDD